MFISYAGILKGHDILINIIPSQKYYGHTNDQGDNLVHGTIVMMNCCYNGLVSVEVYIFV